MMKFCMINANHWYMVTMKFYMMIVVVLRNTGPQGSYWCFLFTCWFLCSLR